MEQEGSKWMSLSTEEKIEKFIIYKQLVQMMGSVAAYTENKAADLANALAEGVKAIEAPENKEEKNIVEELFNEENKALIVIQELFYYGILEKLKQPNTQISQSLKSRIYHTIANIKQEITYNKRQNVFTNKHGIQCLRSNDYNYLQPKDLDQVVKYESIAHHTKQMGEKISFKYESIKRQSQNMVKLLGECMLKHTTLLNGLKYDLSKDEVLQVARISKQACKYHDLGVFVLLKYLAKSCNVLESMEKKPQQIEDLLNIAIAQLQQKYPPGKGLDLGNQFFIEPLKHIQIKNNQKNHIRIKLDPLNKNSNKQEQVNYIILQQAKRAEKCQGLLEKLVEATCLDKCISFKIDLKLYPSNPNKKSLTRIKEKLFCRKQLIQNHRVQELFTKNFYGTVSEIVDSQQTTYEDNIKRILQKQQQIEYTMTDLLSGKCIFVEMFDIIQTVRKIKEFIQENPSHYQLKEVQSRFTNEKLPISDVTLKIEINKETIAELQLSTESDAPAYNFHHQIYELVKTKVFSKLRIIHNNYQELRDDFNQLATRALDFQHAQYQFTKESIGDIKKYFELDNFKLRSFPTILQKVFEENNIFLHEHSVVTDPYIQRLMLGIFSIAIGVWYKPLGRIINSTLQDNNLSSKLKSVLLCYFLNAFQLPKELYFMKQLPIMKQKQQIGRFMEEFFKAQFQINNIFNYERQDYKTFHRTKQLKQIVFFQYGRGNLLKRNRFVVHLVIDEASVEYIEKLREMLNFYFVSRNNVKYGDETLYNYQKWINAKLEQHILKINNNKQMDSLLKNGEIKKNRLLKGQTIMTKIHFLLENNETEQAQKILREELISFKKNNEQRKQLQCEALLIECYAKQKDSVLDNALKLHKLVVQKECNFGLQLSGAFYANAMWRISQTFWKQSARKDYKRKLLETFTSIAIRQMSRSLGEQFIQALWIRWEDFRRYEACKCQILENRKIKDVRLKGRLKGSYECYLLSLAKWVNLTQINLGNNQIGDKGCKHLSQAEWVNLTQINLRENRIGDDGCRHLSKAKWVNLAQINLQQNRIGADGCKHLSEANWVNLTQINLGNNQIGDEGCKHLSKANWVNLKRFIFWQNNISHVLKQSLQSEFTQKNLQIYF